MGIVISTRHDLLDLPMIHRFLAQESSWARGIPFATVAKAIANSICFGAYDLDHEQRQVGFARVISDGATFAYLCDVFTLSAYRGQGISRLMMDAVHAHPDLQNLRRSTLAACRTLESSAAKSPKRPIFHELLGQYFNIDAANPAKSCLVYLIFRFRRPKSDRLLVTTTARGLYEKYGWTSIAKPDSYMERYFPDVYQNPT